MVELPAVLRFQAQTESVLELARRRGDAASREAHEEARRDHGALLDGEGAALRDIAPVQKDLAVEIGRHAELPIRRHRGGEAPRKPAPHAPRRALERRNEREWVTRRLLAPEQNRQRVARLRGGERCVSVVEVALPDGSQPDPARFHNSISSRIAAIPAAAHASSSRPPGAPDTPIAPSSEPPASIMRPPPTAATPGRWRMPLAGRPGCDASASSVVLVRKLAAVYAFAVAISGVCGPAKRSRSKTWTTPMRSTTATVAWKPRSRQLLSAACAALSAVSGVRMRTAYVRSEEHTSELQSRLHLVCRL